MVNIHVRIRAVLGAIPCFWPLTARGASKKRSWELESRSQAVAIGRGGVWAKLDSNGPGEQSGRGVEATIGYLRSEEVCSVSPLRPLLSTFGRACRCALA